MTITTDKTELSAKRLFKRILITILSSMVSLFILVEILPLFCIDNKGFLIVSEFLKDISTVIVRISSTLSITMIGFLLTAFSIIISLAHRKNMVKFFASDGFSNLIYVYKAGFIGNILLLIVHILEKYLYKIHFNIGTYIILAVFAFAVYAIYRCVTAVLNIIRYSNAGNWNNLR